MKCKSRYFILLSLLSNAVFSQDTITIYYDLKWNEIKDITEAAYYRKAYSDNQKEWVVHDYYINDTTQMTGFYKSMKLKIRQGFFTYYYENGKKASEGMYAKDKKSGEWNYWSAEGVLKNTERFANGFIISATGYYENGQRRYSGEYTYGKRQGEWTYWNPEGRITFQGNFNNGLKQGEWIRYFSDGNMKLNYNNGVIEGKEPGGIVRLN
jgi:antitoxin component YwqK of YwqJK toxin-antitoxin module